MEDKKTCLKCGEDKCVKLFSKDKHKKDGLQSYCKSCCSIGNKKYRNDNSEKLKSYYKKYANTPSGRAKIQDGVDRFNSRFPRQEKAKAKINHLIERGKLVRPVICEECWAVEKTQAHHRDYLKPLEVTFLCIPCHRAWHKNNTPLNKG